MSVATYNSTPQILQSDGRYVDSVNAEYAFVSSRPGPHSVGIYIILPSVASTIRSSDNASVDFPGDEMQFNGRLSV